MEHGKKVPIQEFLQGVPDVEQADVNLLDIDIIPTKREIETLYMKAPARKTTGLDGLPAEVFKAAPKEMANLYYGLYLKCLLFTRTPVQWAGGVLQEAAKPGACHSKAEAYRSLYLPG